MAKLKPLSELYQIVLDKFIENTKSGTPFNGICYAMTTSMITKSDYDRVFDDFRVNKPSSVHHEEFFFDESFNPNGSYWWWGKNNNSQRRKFLRKLIAYHKEVEDGRQPNN